MIEFINLDNLFFGVSLSEWLALLKQDVISQDTLSIKAIAFTFLRVLARSELYNQQHKLPHKTLIDWAKQMMLVANTRIADRCR